MVAERIGTLFVVATPIGNRDDITARARRVLAAVDVIAAEDTRHTGQLLDHWGISARLLSLHEHNEAGRIDSIERRLREGSDVALVSDAGTPLISDPGFRLVRALRTAGLPVRVVPGACSVVAALSVAGLPTDRFRFEGFLPAKAGARRERLDRLADEPTTLVFLESSHRIRASIEAMSVSFGADREAVIARELTKAFETLRLDSLAALGNWLAADANQCRGEFVVVVAGSAPPIADEAIPPEAERILRLLCDELPTRQAVKLAARLTELPRNRLYQHALRLIDS